MATTKKTTPGPKVKTSLASKHYRKYWLIILGIGVLVFVGLNSPYFWTQLKFSLSDKTFAPEKQEEGGSASANFLQIPSLKIAAPVIYITGTTEKEFQEALVDGVVHYPGTALPGEAGNVYIFGHSSDFPWSGGHYKTVFALLPRIDIGALITLSGSEGRDYTYKVVQKFVVAPDDLSVLKQDPEKKLLTVQTSYPIGTALKRYIVVAELEQ